MCSSRSSQCYIYCRLNLISPELVLNRINYLSKGQRYKWITITVANDCLLDNKIVTINQLSMFLLRWMILYCPIPTQDGHSLSLFTTGTRLWAEVGGKPGVMIEGWKETGAARLETGSATVSTVKADSISIHHHLPPLWVSQHAAFKGSERQAARHIPPSRGMAHSLPPLPRRMNKYTQGS